MKTMTLKQSLLLAATVLVAGCQDTGIEPLPDSATLPDTEYMLELNGSNTRIIEFTPKGNPDYTCVISRFRGAIDCIPKPEMVYGR